MREWTRTIDQDRHHGEHPAMRWLSVLPGGYFAFYLGLLAAESRYPSFGVLRLLKLLILLLPWVTGILLLSTWRAGPLKNWAIPWLISLSFGAIIMEAGIYLSRAWMFFRGSAGLLFSGLFIIFPITCYLRFLASQYPRRCPDCGRTALISLKRLAKQENRSSNTRWCAFCEGKFWMDRHGVWKTERRTTWHDQQVDGKGSSSPVGPRKLAPDRKPKTDASLTSTATDS